MFKSNLFKAVFFIILMNLSVGTSFSQSNLTYDGKKLFVKVEQKQNSSDKLQNSTASAVNTISTLDLNKSNCDYVFKYSGENIRIENFPINSIDYGTVKLTKIRSAVDPDTKWWRQTKSGLVKGKAPEINSFIGTIEDKSNTKIFLNYCDGFLFANINSIDGHQYDIVSAVKSDKLNSTRITIAEQNSNIKNPTEVNPFECLTEDIVPETTEQEDLFKFGNELQKDQNKLYEVRIAIDAINNFYVAMGNDYEKTRNYIAAVMSQVSYIYEENFNVRLYVPYVLIRESKEEDPYEVYQYNDFEAKLSNMEWIWNGGVNDRPEKVALIFMFAALRGQPSGSIVAGLSYSGTPGIGVLCDTKYGFGIAGLNENSNYPNYNYTWDVNVVAHEMGHNFGLQHTHSCYYQPNMIDTCVTQTLPIPIGDACLTGQNIPRPGTLMSYCHLANATSSVQLKFHEREIPLVRKAVKRAECLLEITNPTVDILAPLVENQFIAGDTIHIRWTSTKINKINIYYSIDDGSEWTRIASSISANDSIYKWVAPKIETNNMIFKIEDDENTTYYDISDSKITIIVPSIIVTVPSVQKEYSNLEKVELTWNANVTKKFNGYFSSDNGTTWVPLFENYYLSSYNYDLPDINSDYCLFKVVDANDQTLIALSPLFSVGTAFLQLSGPRKEEILCAGRKYNITWNYKYLNNFIIEYSINNGTTWKKSSFGTIDAENKEYNWSIPNITSDSVLVKAVLADDPNIVLYQADHYFAIDTCAASVEENTSSKSSIQISRVIPNPLNTVAEMRIVNNSNDQNADLSVINIAGVTVWKNGLTRLLPGENILHIDLSTLPQGDYYVILKNANCNLSYPISIVR